MEKVIYNLVTGWNNKKRIQFLLSRTGKKHYTHQHKIGQNYLYLLPWASFESNVASSMIPA